MIISELWIYPIKSCQGIQLKQAEVTPKGFLWDRELMLVTEKGKFLTQRQYPNLAKVRVELNGATISLSVENNTLETITFTPTLTGQAREIEIWRDRTLAIDQGDEVAEWFHAFLALESHQKCRLVRQSPEHTRLVNRQFASNNESVSFADGYPFLLTATSSLVELNRRIEEIYHPKGLNIPMDRFRPNIVIETDAPFVEENWQLIQIGQVKFASVKPCSRCIITTTDQRTGIRNEFKEPLRTLSTFRQFGEQGVMFGENLIPRNTGIIKVGEQLKVLKFRGKTY